MDDIRSTIVVPGRAAVVELVAGQLCLDFANTVEPRVAPQHGGRPKEYLASYADLVEWTRHAEVVTDEIARWLLTEAERQPGTARAVFEQAIALRESIYRSFLSIAARKKPSPKDLALLHEMYTRAISNSRLEETAEGFDLVWAVDTDLERPLWPIARSAVELLMRGDALRIKDCRTGEDGCGWLFYDTSKNNSRRWCSMRGCGNPAKERRRAQRRMR